jgi:hypothetical protein
MIAFALANWRLIAIVIAFAAIGGYAAVMRMQRDSVRAEYAEFREKSAQAAAAAAEIALKKTIADEQRKELTDAEHAKTVIALSARIKRLRDANPAGGFVPAAPAGSGRPDLACFDRAEYQRADGVFIEGARGLSDEGTASTLDLDTAKFWVKGRE